MANKPDLHLTMPEQQKPDVHLPQSATRSPRFVEDFEAPFSEALLNASRTTLVTDSSENSPAAQQWSGFETQDSLYPQVGSIRKSPSSISRPAQTREDSWSSSDSSRSSTVNDKLRNWARKSMRLSRRRSEQESVPQHRRSS